MDIILDIVFDLIEVLVTKIADIISANIPNSEVVVEDTSEGRNISIHIDTTKEKEGVVTTASSDKIVYKSSKGSKLNDYAVSSDYSNDPFVEECGVRGIKNKFKSKTKIL